MSNKKIIRSPQRNRVLIRQKPLERHSFAAPAFPFSAIVGQEDMKLALILNAIDPSIGGALLMGHRGTGKSTAARGLADLLPEIISVQGCVYRCDPARKDQLCRDCRTRARDKHRLPRERVPVPIVDLPLGATEDRVGGTIDIERALKDGVKAFEPGLLARANRGFLYVDEVNLLEDHLVDLLLDVAATGVNKVEREGISIEHPARFVLIGSGNPEEGELRPQLIDRFGLHVEVKTELDPDLRVEVVQRRDTFERDPDRFRADVESEQSSLRQRLIRARRKLGSVKVPKRLLRRIAELCGDLNIDGHRGELTITRAARALAALGGRCSVTDEDVRRVAPMALRHRLRRDALDEGGGSARIDRALDKVFPDGAVEKLARTQKRSHNDHSTGDEFEGGGKRGNRRSGTSPRGNLTSNSLIDQRSPAAADVAATVLNLKSNSRKLPVSQIGQSRAGMRRTSYNVRRGRYIRATSIRKAAARIAIDATLRAALVKAVGKGCFSLQFSPADLRFKSFRQKPGRLFIVAIDTSGSMALNRIQRAKRALLHLLRQSHINRDGVAIVTFRGSMAEVALPASRSMLRARRVLESLHVGGSTPLSAGLACSLDLARRALEKREREVFLLLFTDGHANVPLEDNGSQNKSAREAMIGDEVRQLGIALHRIGVTRIVIESQDDFLSTGAPRALADALGAQHLCLSLAPRLQPR